MIQAWIKLARQPRYRRRIVFLEDYDIALAQELVQGVDVWINTPRRPWEACGTSGMKVLVNGGLNCSILDGWWDEAYEAGRRLGDRRRQPAAMPRRSTRATPKASMISWSGRSFRNSMIGMRTGCRAPGSRASDAACRR